MPLYFRLLPRRSRRGIAGRRGATGWDTVAGLWRWAPVRRGFAQGAGRRRTAENAVWSYERPYDEMTAIEALPRKPIS